MSPPASALRFGVVGYGRIGRRIVGRLEGATDIECVGVVVRGAAEASPGLACADVPALLARWPQVVVECASAAALAEHGPSILQAGSDLMPLSLAAFADPDTEASLMAAAAAGPGRIELPPGAAGSLGLIAAAREDGLGRVAFRQSYPASIWRGSAAAAMTDLDAATTRTVFFTGSVREAARIFPRNLNVAVGVALAGLGLDRTEVELAVDPAIPHANYEIALDAGPGPVRLSIGHRDAPEGADPSDYTAFSVIRLLKRRAARLMI